ncbi:MAG TPA: phosphatidylinositol-specific phospholipase C [Dongiaceae bacterium]|jgi:1-phosphatidylinositol phosphodiesterase|nr:phosphatidylinositol-specific phospholipase C [Dongiaceae bacterium]
MKLLLAKWLGLGLVVWPLLAGAAGTNWMAAVPGDRLLSQLSIPGTHDAGARHEPFPGTAKCQELSLSDQLAAGVRFLDIRCRHVKDAFVIHHGSVDQHLSFDEVLQAVFGFLKAHPSECVIMSIKEEYDASGDTRSFEKTFATYVAKNPGQWYLGAKLPQLDQVRGRIVLFRRFSAQTGPLGIDASVWPDNRSFNVGEILRVQDNYEVSDNAVKWRQIEGLLDEAKAGKPDTLFVNFASGYQSTIGIPNLVKVANDINPRLAAYMQAHPQGRYGVILMDFAMAARCKPIYDSNFPDLGKPAGTANQ